MSLESDNEVSEQDLEWFKLDNYKGLKDFQALEWSRLIGDRLAIRRALDGGTPESVCDLFLTLTDLPLQWLGSDVRYTGADHSANTATVKSMNVRRLVFLSNELTHSPAFVQETATKVSDDDSPEFEDAVIDELLDQYPDSSFRRFAHVMVSIDAPREQIEKDFKRWLASRQELSAFDYRNGDYLQKARSWREHCAVQFYDLDLFERLTGRLIPSRVRWSKLFPGLAYEALESKKKNVRSAAALAFSEDTYRLLRHLAYEFIQPQNISPLQGDR
jgi:hypothetical protein